MDLQFGDFRLKRHERQVVGPGGVLDLSARAFDILAALLSKPDEPVGKDELFATVWPGVAVEENTLQVHVSALRKHLGPGLIVTVHGRGYKYAGPAPASAEHPAPMPPDLGGRDRKPVIAVLPFADPGLDPDQQYFADGITDDIIDRLSKYRVLSVISRYSTFAFRGREHDIEEIRRKLSADFVLSGSVRRSGPRLRVAARLTDIRRQTILWADHFDRPLEDIFAIQDEVTSTIASKLHGHVEFEMGRHMPANARDVTSHEHVMRGIWHFRTLTVAGNAAATECFKAALGLDPSNAYAYRWLSICYVNHWLTHHRRADLREGLDLARRSTELDPGNALCFTALAFVQIWAEGLEAAAATYRKALALNPDDPNVIAEVGLLHAYRGDHAKALEFLDRAEQLNPLPPLWYGEFRGVAAFADERYAEALPGFAAVPECAYDTCYVMACRGHLGDRAGIAAVMPRIREQNWDLIAVAADEPFQDPAIGRRLIDGVERALALAKG